MSSALPRTIESQTWRSERAVPMGTVTASPLVPNGLSRMLI